jgi:hypothetical protein
MIEAWFTSYSGNGVKHPVILPTPEIIEWAAVLGMTVNDLFEVHIPTGFSRVGTVKCLVSNETMRLLYPPISNPDLSNYARKFKFFWRDNADPTQQANPNEIFSMAVRLLPPRPLFARASLASPAQPEGLYPPALFLITGEDDRSAMRGAQVVPNIYATAVATDQTINITNTPQRVSRDYGDDGTSKSSWENEAWFQRSHSSDGKMPPPTLPDPEVDYLLTAMIESTFSAGGVYFNYVDMVPWQNWLNANSRFRDMTAGAESPLLTNGAWAKNKVCLNWNNQPLGMACDLLASNCGGLLVPRLKTGGFENTYKVVQIQNGYQSINEEMASSQRAMAGGVETIREQVYSAGQLTDPLFLFWQRFGAPTVDLVYSYCYQRVGRFYSFSFPMRGPEQNQATNNVSAVEQFNSPDWGFGKALDNPNRLDILRELNFSYPTRGSSVNYADNHFDDSGQRKGVYALNRQVFEPRTIALHESESNLLQENWTGLSPSGVNNQVQAWDFWGYSNWCRDQVSTRNSLPFNKTVWAGWGGEWDTNYMIRSSYIRFHLAVIKDQIVPICTTECDYDDWVLGPNGETETASNPKDMVFSNGNVHARRVLSGALVIDVPPPTTRTFAAQIVSATRIAPSGDFYWRWRYEWTEVDPPTPADTIANQVNNWVKQRGTNRTRGRSSEKPWTRDPSLIKNYAFNLAENGNHFVGAGNAANTIATGVLQSDYTASTIDALPISVGTIVAMHENAMTMYSKTDLVPTNSTMRDSPLNCVFWFSIPNSVKVTCI